MYFLTHSCTLWVRSDDCFWQYLVLLSYLSHSFSYQEGSTRTVPDSFISWFDNYICAFSGCCKSFVLVSRNIVANRCRFLGDNVIFG